MQAQYLLRENIKAILRARGEDASALSGWLGHDKSWINKILNGHRDMQIEDFDRVADFLGIATYQLFQPGISRLTERRQNRDRRAGAERRIGHKGRVMLATQAELTRVRARPPATGKGRHATAAVVDPVQAINEAAGQVHRLDPAVEKSRRQAAMAGGPKAGVRARARTAGGSADSLRPSTKIKPK